MVYVVVLTQIQFKCIFLATVEFTDY